MDFLKDMQKNTMNLNYAYLHPKKKKRSKVKSLVDTCPVELTYTTTGTGIKQVNKYTISNCDKC